MPKARKRKTPITSVSPIASSSTLASEDASKPAAKRTRTVIRRFHVLLKRQKQLSDLASSVNNGICDVDLTEFSSTNNMGKRKGKARASEKDLEREREREEIEREITALGGLAEYQRMSAAGQSDARGGSSAKVLVGWLKNHGLDKREGRIQYALCCLFSSQG
jgi:25S rRNA (adenine2142-N1)-methyltransferase